MGYHPNSKQQLRSLSHTSTSYQIYYVFSNTSLYKLSELINTTDRNTASAFNRSSVWSLQPEPSRRCFVSIESKPLSSSKDFSLYQWQSLLLRLGCSIAIQEIRESASKSASTQSRRCITISVDDTNDPRYGKLLSYCYNWWSKKQNNTIRGRNVLAITIKIGSMIIPLNIRIFSKQGRGNTDKPSLFDTMLRDVLDFFEAQGIELRKYPITFDSWYGSKELVQSLSDLGFDHILVHGKNNYVMTIDNTTTKLSAHKKQIQLNTD